ncbi:MAG: hypothetical protein EXQ97_01185 [Alphaproteobacteria bacterium]|nr:hypothetical protein [Alphaproteobacteria bacterium]
MIAAEGVEIGVFRVVGELFAWHNECPHQGGPVCQGRLMKGVEERLDADRRSLGIHYAEGRLNLACPWHGWEFDLRSGRHAGLASGASQAWPCASATEASMSTPDADAARLAAAAGEALAAACSTARRKRKGATFRP